MQYPHNQRQTLNGPFDFITDGLDCVTHPSRCIKNIASDVGTGLAILKSGAAGQLPSTGSGASGVVVVPSQNAMPSWAMPVGIGAGFIALALFLKG